MFRTNSYYSSLLKPFSLTTVMPNGPSVGVKTVISLDQVDF